MSADRKTAMLIFGIVAAFAFLFQTMTCFAEQAGIIPCHEQTADNSSAGTNAVEDGHCCHVESNACLLGQPVAAAPIALSEVDFHPRDFGAPEGPVKEIDYPPQLS